MGSRDSLVAEEAHEPHPPHLRDSQAQLVHPITTEKTSSESCLAQVQEMNRKIDLLTGTVLDQIQLLSTGMTRGIGAVTGHLQELTDRLSLLRNTISGMAVRGMDAQALQLSQDLIISPPTLTQDAAAFLRMAAAGIGAAADTALGASESQPSMARLPASSSNTSPIGQTYPLATRPPKAAALARRDAPARAEYTMSKTITTITQAWREYRYGLEGRPSIREMEASHKGWRTPNTKAQRFCRRRPVWIEIERRMEGGMSEEEAVQALEDERVQRKESLFKCAERLKTEHKLLRLPGGEVTEAATGA
ncbi:transcriptional activator of glycolytic enzymes-domain-containing protein [Blyttiomyces helicus]|uniref:Transcriptional activator of glycolytic enzymes-domain-containing protein n=1 Tax=Blyttiomyces helicus TaxID=388810 RepID=A0A4P9VX19_9FUNG|nr:transcriptional activator of glycolytic enzymes-domain-containing protein [Blyttiomyces helicus]|eukprot:RKO83415.1 transcriptional activator of glycolytic enzymes-domain-containing protein [Blyttiomyces helicus]